MSNPPTLRIRFSLNRSTNTRSNDQVHHASRKFAVAVVDNIGVTYADGLFKRFKQIIEPQLRRAVMVEVNHVAMMFRQFIVGNQRIGGTLTTVTRGKTIDRRGNYPAEASVNLRSTIPEWGPRDPKYLARKGNTKWFEYSGYLGTKMYGKDFIEMFGPIMIRVSAKTPAETSSQNANYDVSGLYTKRFAVAQVSVGVFGKVTPRMVTALINGDMSTSTGDGRTDGLLKLVSQYDMQLAQHLGYNRKHKYYRPTLEPFIAFAITRALPAAVFNTLGDEVREVVGSAGRTRARE